MSYPAILPTLAAFAPTQQVPQAHRNPAPFPSTSPEAQTADEQRRLAAPPRSAAPSARPARARWAPPAPRQLFDALKLAVRDALHAGLGERLDSYRSCRWCTARAMWCAEGVPGTAETPGTPRTSRASWPAGRGGTAADADDLGVSLDVLRLILSAEDLGACRPALTLGAKADPYPQAEASLGLTRHLLEVLAAFPEGGRLPSARHDVGRDTGIRARGTRGAGAIAAAGGGGLSLTVLTRSPLLLRDLDLLAELDQRHAVRVGVVIGAADRALARRIEPQARPWQDAGERVTGASPAERFALVRELADRGIDASVVCTPLVPGFNNGAAALCRLFERAAAAGAADVVPAPRHPALPPTAFESRHLLPLFHRLRLEHGFPRALPGRG
jgi:hypothetical protein